MVPLLHAPAHVGVAAFRTTVLLNCCCHEQLHAAVMIHDNTRVLLLRVKLRSRFIFHSGQNGKISSHSSS